jgi:hypothetical protein
MNPVPQLGAKTLPKKNDPSAKEDLTMYTNHKAFHPMRLIAILILALGPLHSGCDSLASERDDDDVTRFFQKGRFGNSPDAGLMKQSVFRPNEWHLVAVFHGSTADLENCEDSAQAIMATSGGKYKCILLNR